jgi:streptogramin lyase
LLAALTQFPLPSNTDASTLTVGADGNLWFSAAQAIGRITPSGAITEFPLALNNSGLGGLISVVPPVTAMAAGPDGNIWFAQSFLAGTAHTYVDGSVGRITPSGAITEFPLSDGDSAIDALTMGPDGNLWFTENTDDFGIVYSVDIGRITPTGAITEFPIPSYLPIASPLTTGLDGNLWFTAAPRSNSGYIGRITPAGAITEFPIPSTDGLPRYAPTVGPDGNLWFSVGGGIGRITSAGVITDFPLPSTSSGPLTTMTVGPDGNLWFPESTTMGSKTTAAVGRITLSGALTEFPIDSAAGVPISGSYASTLTVGPDKNLYFSIALAAGAPPAVIVGGITPSGDAVVIPGTAPSYTSADALIVGPDGNLWFPDGVNIGRIDPTQVTFDQTASPSITAVDTVGHSRKAISTITLGFDAAMDPGSASTRLFYKLDAGVKKHHTLVFSKSLKIGRVSYYGTTHTVALKLAAPFKGEVQVMVHAGVMATSGTSTRGTFTAVVS